MSALQCPTEGRACNARSWWHAWRELLPQARKTANSDGGSFVSHLPTLRHSRADFNPVLILKIRAGGIRNGHFRTWWHRKWPFLNLVAPETSISELGEIGNGDIERMTPQGLRGVFNLPTKISKCFLKVLLKSCKLLCWQLKNFKLFNYLREVIYTWWPKQDLSAFLLIGFPDISEI